MYDPYCKEGQKDPQGPETGSRRVLRGGSWSFGGWYCRAASRDGNATGSRSYLNGVRVVLSAARTP